MLLLFIKLPVTRRLPDPCVQEIDAVGHGDIYFQIVVTDIGTAAVTKPEFFVYHVGLKIRHQVGIAGHLRSGYFLW